MKNQLNEVQKLQKVAGILKEAVDVKNIITQLDKIAKSKGFKLVKPINDHPDVKKLARWINTSDASSLAGFKNKNHKEVELFYFIEDSPNESLVSYDAGRVGGTGSIKQWLNPATWDKYLELNKSSKDDMSDIDLYKSVAKDIGKRTLDKLLDSGWELEDIAQDPQGAADSL
jgi:hypothetical protein